VTDSVCVVRRFIPFISPRPSNGLVRFVGATGVNTRKADRISDVARKPAVATEAVSRTSGAPTNAVQHWRETPTTVSADGANSARVRVR
jgi:hypothetical protein